MKKRHKIRDIIIFGLLLTSAVTAVTKPLLAQEIPNTSKSSQPIKEIDHLKDQVQPTRSANMLVQSPTPSTQPSTPPQPAVVLVTNVQVVKTGNGIQIILNTPNGQKREFFSSSFGPELLTYFLNTKLQLPVGQEFHLKNPKPGIESVDVTQLDARTLEVRIVGDKVAPSVSVEQDSGRVVESVTPVLSTAQPQKPTASGSNNQPIEIDVTAKPDTGYNATDATTGTRTLTPNLLVPQTVESVPRQVIEDQGANRVGDVLRNLGIEQSAEPSRLGESVKIRGFQVEASNTLRDGLRDNLTNLVGTTFQNDLANIERIEVLKGPASVLYGNGSPGGVYNIVTKQPLSTPYYSIEGNVGSYSLYKSSIDFSGPLTTDKKLLYRFNADYENSGSYINYAYAERAFFAPVITWQPSQDTKLTISGEYLSSRQLEFFPVGLPAIGTILPNPNGKIPPNTYLGDPTQDRVKVTEGRVGYNFEHSFSDNWSLYNSFRYAFVDRPYSTDTLPGSLQTNNRTLTRSDQIWDPFTISNFSQDTHVVGKFNTFGLEHQLLVGVDWYQRIISPYGFTTRTFPAIDIYNPVYGETPGKITGGLKRKLSNEDLGVYVQDQLALAPNLKLVLGGREDFAEQRDVSTTLNNPTSVTDQSNSAFSPRLGIVYQPIPPVSLYASYSRSFDLAVGTNATGNPFVPTRGTQYEVGVKTDLLNNKLSATLALYQLTQTNITTIDPNDPTFSIQVGEQRSRGVELYITGELTPGWNIIASYNYIDPRVTRDNTYKPGSLLQNTPENSASIWTTYIIPKGKLQGFGGGVGVFYFGDREGDLTNTFTLPSYVRTDAALYYRRHNFQAALNFKNLFDILYYEGSYNINRVFRGDPFEVEATLKWQF